MGRYPQSLGRDTLFEQAPAPGSDAPFRSGRPAVFVLLLILILILFGSGFLNPLWWWVAAVLVLGATRHGRDRGGGWIRGDGSDAGDYRDYEHRRDRQDRWDRRYSRRHRARWRRADRRDYERRG
ncbi:hypothetical protein SAMN05216482_5031 [Streptomyces sp. PAN_FS17]|nr:hypothetical protein SAMN05216482_5031 [Streptomyces sp. PAN_FS17]